ncbi:MAG: hypothetical protein AB2L20_04825 [Mangrovibacterium sp.]
MNFLLSVLFSVGWSVRMAIHFYQLALFNQLNGLEWKRSNVTLRILGNGKSLNEVLDGMKSEFVDYMVVNRHILSESYQTLKPRYYVLADPHFFDSPEGLSLLERIRKETSWPMILFVPSWRKVIKKVKNIFAGSATVTVVPFNAMEYKGFRPVRFFLYRHNLSCPRVRNVMVAAIYTGICMKYQIIELYGTEHSWVKYLSVNEYNEVCLENPHFFDKNDAQVKTWRELFGEEEKLYRILQMYADMFEAYLELEEFAEQSFVEVLNCTKGSFIDAFKRKITR